MTTLGLLISGGLGKTILDTLLNKEGVKLLFVLTDSHSTPIYDACEKAGIPVFKGNPRNARLTEFLDTLNRPEIILSVNYLFIVGIDLINKAKKAAINIHGSLLPKYRGRTPHVWAIINNEKYSGLTAHLMDEGCDTGEIVEQVKIPILENYTGQHLLDIFHKEVPELVNRILLKLSEGELKSYPQDNLKASFFGKRTPEDGRINWDWQKERIYNWVRAQSKPYPGAFTFYSGNKVIVHKLEFSDIGFDNEMPNGTIIDNSKKECFVKTQNGVVKLFDLEPITIEFKKGEVLT